jgi:hypothetical protein
MSSEMIEKDGKVYIRRRADRSTLAKFRKKQHIIMAGRATEDFFIKFKDSRILFVDAGHYVFEDVDLKLKTMDQKNFEKHHEIEQEIEFVTIKFRKEVEDKIKRFMEDFKKYRGKINEEAMKLVDTGDINMIAGHLLLDGIDNVRNKLGLLEKGTNEIRRQLKRKNRGRS